MIDLKKAKLPQAVEVGGSFFKIHTDFSYFLRMAELLHDKTVQYEAFDFMYIGEPPKDRAAGLQKLYEFMAPPRELPRRTGDESAEVVMDYTADADYIYAAFIEQYGIDLLKKRLHWYQFCALLHGLHDTELNRIIQCRLWKPNGKNDEYEKTRQKQYEAWRLTQPDEKEPDEALDEFLSQIKR